MLRQQMAEIKQREEEVTTCSYEEYDHEESVAAILVSTKMCVLGKTYFKPKCVPL